jgi:hypothetical protein
VESLCFKEIELLHNHLEMKNDKTPITRKKAERKILVPPVRVESAKATMIRINAKKHIMKSNTERDFLMMKNRNENDALMELMYLSLALG